MARPSTENAADVTPESQSSGQANPMDEPSANPTEAEVEQGAQEGINQPQAVDPSPEGPTDAALKQAREDQKLRDENPNKAVVREANPEVGGESFAYLKRD